MPLNTNYFSDLHKMFHVAFIKDTDEEREILIICYSLFLNYTDKRYTYTYRLIAKKEILDSADLKTGKFTKFSVSKI